MPQERILEAIDDHVNQMRTWYHWFFPAVTLCFLAIASGKDPISLLGAEVPQRDAGIIVSLGVAFYVLKSATAFLRLSALLAMLDTAHAQDGLAAVRLKSWTGNPFAISTKKAYGLLDGKLGSFLFGMPIGLATFIISLCYIHSEDWVAKHAYTGFAAIGIASIALVCSLADVQQSLERLELMCQTSRPKSLFRNHWYLLFGVVGPMISVVYLSFTS